MAGTIFAQTLRHSWRPMMFAGLAFASMALLIVVIIPEADALQGMINFLESMPPFVLGLIGIDPSNVGWLATPEGWIAAGFFGKMLLIMAVYPIVIGLRVTTNEEADGVLDIVVSLPVPRWRVVLEKFLAYTASLFGVAALVFIGLWIGEGIMQLGLDMGRILETVLNIIPALLFILAFTTLVGTVLHGRRVIIGVAAAFVIASFMLESLGTAAQGTIAENLRIFSIFAYNDSVGVMQTGIVWVNALGLVGIALAMLVVSIWAFERRDVGT